MGRGYLCSMKPFLPTFFVLIGWFLQPFGRMGDSIFFIGAILLLLGGVFYTRKLDTTRAKEQEAGRIKEFLSRQRHDWMNDIQVVLGYLSLRKYDRMKSYLQQQVQKANQERLITQLHYDPLAMKLFTLPQDYLHWRIQIKVEDLFQYTIHEEQGMLHIIEHVFWWLEQQLRSVVTDLQVNIHLSKKKDFVLAIYIQDQQGGSTPILMNDLEKMRKTIRKWNGDLTFIQHENKIQIKLV